MLMLTPPNHANLTDWAKQGILMLNVVLTVREGQSNSHKNKGWETFTDEIIRLVNQKEETVVFVLWGKPAQKKIPLIDAESTLSFKARILRRWREGFLGSRPFSKINQALKNANRGEIDWRIKD
jgi:uracil-DNA glycosylase